MKSKRIHILQFAHKGTGTEEWYCIKAFDSAEETHRALFEQKSSDMDEVIDFKYTIETIDLFTVE
jgi:hypothetical protein